jgi:hypothetical protein
LDLSKTIASAFDPRDPLHRRKLWVRVQTPANAFYHIYWRRLIGSLTLLTVLGWLAAAAAVWTYVRTTRGFDGASYINIALPWRWSEHRASLGRHYLARARIELEQQDYAAAYQHLTAGLNRAPTDTAGRKLLAFVQIRFGRPDLALRTLTDGAQLAGSDLEYLRLLFNLLIEAQQDDRVIAIAKTLLPAKPDAVLSHQFVALQAATAHFHRGRYDDTEKIISDWGLERSLEGNILLARCDWERGYPDLALLRLENNLPRFPRRDELYVALIRYYRELGRTDAARQTALLRRFNDPTSPGPRIDVLHTTRATSEPAAIAREIDTYLKDFAADPQALILLAWFGSDTAQPALVQRTLTLARERKYLPNAFNLALAQAQIAASDYRGALATAEAALREENEDNRFFTGNLNGLRALALFGLRDTERAELMLDSFLSTAQLRASDALFLAQQLRLLGALPSARRVLARAVSVDSLNQAALTELVRLDAAASDRTALAQNLPKLLAMRKPARAVLEECLLRLDQPADEALRTAIHTALDRVTRTPAPN